MRRLTDARIERLKPKPKQFVVQEPSVPGLELRVSPRGRKSWSLRRDGRRTTLGVWPEMSAERARDAATKPVSKRVTLHEVTTKWLLSCGRVDLDEPRRVLEARIWPTLGADTLAEYISRKDVAQWVRSMRDEGLGRAALNRYFGVLRAAMRAAVADGLIDSAECVTMIRAGGQEQPREEVWNDDQLRAGWAITGIPGRALRIAMATGLRVGTVCQLKWEWIDSDAIRIPSEAMKARRAHVVPMTPLLKDLLGEPQGVWVLPGRGRDHLDRHTISRAVRRAEIPCRPHDLRRTIGTWLAEQGVALEVISAVLAHTPQGITASTYLGPAALQGRVREALSAWQERLAAVLRS